MPLTKEGVMTGIQVTFIPSLSLFMITRLIAGNKVINIGTAIEEQFLTIQNYGMVSTIAIFLIVFMAFILIITKSSNGEGESYEMVWKAVYRDTFSDFIHPNILFNVLFIQFGW